MSRDIAIGETNLNLRAIYFDLRTTDGITPALSEVGGQPEININGAGWDSSEIEILQSLGNGKYKAPISSIAINTVGIILSRYKSSNTAEIPGETLVVREASRLELIFNSDPEHLTNSYVDGYEGDNYFATRLNSSLWDCTPPEDKMKSLIMATRAIDRLAFDGVKTSNTQALEFPRNLETVVPTNIKIACCEIAYAFLDGIDMEFELANLSVTDQRLDTIRETCDRSIVETAKRAGIPSAIAWTYLIAYLKDPNHILLCRV